MSTMSKKEKTPTGELRDVDVKFVSLVKKGANRTPFKIYKSADYQDDAEAGELEKDETNQAVGFFKMMKDFFMGTGEKAAIEKADTVAVQEPATFGAVIAAEEARSKMWRTFDAISTVFWNIMRSDATNKRALMEKSLDEFKVIVLQSFDALAPTVKVKKEAGEEIEIEKAGKKISSSRLEALKAARVHLDQVISEAEAAGVEAEPVAKTETGEEEIDMKPEDLKAILKSAIDESLAPVTARLDKIEKGDEGGEKPEDNKPAELTAESISKAVKEAVTAATQPLNERIEKMEKARGLSNQEPEDTQNRKPVEKSGEDWGALFIVPSQQAAE